MNKECRQLRLSRLLLCTINNEMPGKGKAEASMNKLLQSKRKGFAIALVLLVIVILLATGTGLLSLGLHSRIFAIRNASDIAARCAADAGLTKALFEMNEKLEVKPWDDSTLPQTTNEVLLNCDATFSYTVTVNSSGAGDGDDQGEDDQGQDGDSQGEDDQGGGDQGGSGDSVYIIESTGKANQAEAKVGCTLRLRSVFEYGIFTQGDIYLRNGTTIDAYNLDAGETLKIGTNSTDAGTITARIGVTINGDVVVGAGGDPDVVINSLMEATITGETYAGASYILPSVTVPEAIQALPSQGIITDEATITTSGKYDGINLGLGGEIKIDGPVTLYVTGDITLNNSAELEVVKTNPDASLTLYLGGNLLTQNGGVVNNMTQDPRKLEILGLDSCTAIDFKTNSVFYGTICAPNAGVRLFNSVEFYGAVIADSFMQDVAANFHYDASLRDATVNDEGVRFVVDRWSEQ